MEMKIKGSLMKMIISKIIEKFIYKKLGYSVMIFLNDLEITSDEEGNESINISAKGKVSAKTLVKIKEDLGL